MKFIKEKNPANLHIFLVCMFSVGKFKASVNSTFKKYIYLKSAIDKYERIAW